MGQSQASTIPGPSSGDLGTSDHASRSPEALIVESNADSVDPHGFRVTRDIYSISSLPRAESSSRHSFSSSLNQHTPARSFFHRTFDSQTPIQVADKASQGVRDDTAELASWALSDITNRRYRGSPKRGLVSSTQSKSVLEEQFSPEHLDGQISDSVPRPEVIIEVSDSSSPQYSSPSPRSHGASALTQMLRQAPPVKSRSGHDTDGNEAISHAGILPVIVDQGIISQPSEHTALFLKKAAFEVPTYGSLHEIEPQPSTVLRHMGDVRAAAQSAKADTVRMLRIFASPKSWNMQAIWWSATRQPLRYIPPVILGLLLNVLDALSYGMILFPLNEPTFAKLGPDGISIFYVSCIISQLVFSCGGSIFKGGVGSEMIEVVPFFHKMAYTILEHIGEDDPRTVIATTILAYSISSIFTGAVFYLMGRFRIGDLIGFFPRHILLGCIGGVGWFLVATGFEVSAGLDSNLVFDIPTLKKLFEADTVALWSIPLGLAILLTITKKWVFNHALTDAMFFLFIIATFYWFVWAIPELTLPDLRSRRWVFEAPEAGAPFYHFYELYDFGAVNWEALLKTVPSMLAVTFFGVLHVPINIPALGLSMMEDDVDINRELRAHGVSNALSGCCGSIQNYLVYTNTVLFVRSGGNTRYAGVLLAIGTFVVLVNGPGIVGFIPKLVVGTLIFFLGIDLLIEALVSTWGKVNRLEYCTIVVIIVTMGGWDFVAGILVGILMACVSSVLQTSQISAIRGQLYGGVANSTVRRHPIQQRFLKEAGTQIHVMKLAGHLFFGTIVGVEKQIRALLDDSQQPIRLLILDLYNVDGVDYSAAEAFTRINRILNGKGVQLVICGFAINGKMGKSLGSVGLFNEADHVQYFQSLNSALEYCENELLKIFYYQKASDVETESSPMFLEVAPSARSGNSNTETHLGSSPRQSHLHQVAATTLGEQHPSIIKWQNYGQPLQLILQTFSTVSDKDEDFWRPAAGFYVRRSCSAGSLLYRAGDAPKGFYLLESGMLKARYDLPQGKYSELIVAGTTCGELPFFSSTDRTSTTEAETDCVTWMLDQERWSEMQRQEPSLAQELLKISLKLTSERMDAITKYMLLTSG